VSKELSYQTANIENMGIVARLLLHSLSLVSIASFSSQNLPQRRGYFALSSKTCLTPFHLGTLSKIPVSRAYVLRAVDVKSDDLDQQQESAEEESDDEDEYELVEYENLTEFDFYNSEWKVGTNWNNKKKEVDLTWVRLIVDENNNNVAVWGTGAKGTWKLDEAAQFISVSQESWGGWTGKKIWAGPMDDYYFMQGTVRGWNPISPASVLGLWQMIRLGVDKEEAGTAPWLDEEEETGLAVSSESDTKEI